MKKKGKIDITGNPELNTSRKDGSAEKSISISDGDDPKQNTISSGTISDYVVKALDTDNSVHKKQNENKDSGSNSPSMFSIDLDSSETSHPAIGEKHSSENQSRSAGKEPTASPKLVSLESDSSETLNSKENDADIACEIPKKDVKTEGEQKIIVVSDGHKEFQVQNVSESELSHEIANSKKNIPESDVHSFFQRPSNPLSGRATPTTDINNQDTIGPLDNPDFLRTLHYSMSLHPTISQPVLQGDFARQKFDHDLRSLSIYDEPPDLDKGWAWVVLFAGFASNMLLGATIYAAGVLMLTILKEINPDLMKVSWVGSLFVCSLCLCGPFVQVVVNRFGSRVTVFCAGIVVTSAFIGASFATNISELILTHGLIAGVGAGFVANPMTVAVGQYFSLYRGLACGLMATGAGAGMLTGGTIISVLLEHYGLSGTYLIWAGLLSHTALLGLLLRPSPEERLRAQERVIVAKEPHHHPASYHPVLSGLNSTCGSMNQSIVSGMDKIGYGKRSTWSKRKINVGDPETPLLEDEHGQGMNSGIVEPVNNLPVSQLVSAYQNHQFSPNLGDKDYRYLAENVTATPRTSSPPTVPFISQYTLSNNTPNTKHNSADIVTASHSTQTVNIKNSSISNTCGFDKFGHGSRLTRPTFLNETSSDHWFATIKPAAQHEDFNPSQSVPAKLSHPRSQFISPSRYSRFNQGSSSGDRQFMSLSTSPFATPKRSSPQTIPSLSKHTLASNVCNSPVDRNIRKMSVSDETYDCHSQNSQTSSLMRSKTQSNRLSLVTSNQYKSLSRSSLQFSLRGSLHPSHFGDMDIDSVTSVYTAQHQPRDILLERYPVASQSITTFMGSVASIPIALAIVKDDVARFDTVSTTSSQELGLPDPVIRILHSFRLLRRKSFVIFLSVCFLWSMGESPIMMYLPTYAISQGTTTFQASMLYTAMGTGSIVGRFLSGLTATDSNIGAVNLFMGCFGIAGALVTLSPYITTTFMEQIVFSCLVGIYTGSLVPLSSLAAIEMLEIRELGKGFGFISMAQGVGYLIGPPLASIVVRTFGYRNSFMCSGFVLISGSVLAMVMAVFLKHSKVEEEEKENNFDQLYSSDMTEAPQQIAGNKLDNDGNEENISSVMFPAASEAKDNFGNEDKLDTIMEVAGK